MASTAAQRERRDAIGRTGCRRPAHAAPIRAGLVGRLAVERHALRARAQACQADQRAHLERHQRSAREHARERRPVELDAPRGEHGLEEALAAALLVDAHGHELAGRLSSSKW
jgi:hypothetical protein